MNSADLDTHAVLLPSIVAMGLPSIVAMGLPSIVAIYGSALYSGYIWVCPL